MRVLVIEDNRIDRLAITRLLDDEALELHWTNDGEPGLRMIDELPRPLIVLLDLHLITMDAGEVLDRLGDWPDDLRIFVITGEDEEDLRANVLEHDVAGYLTKQSIEEHDLRAILAAAWHEMVT